MNRRAGLTILALVSLLLVSMAAMFLLQGGDRQLPLDKIKLPSGFKISLYNGEVPGARSMTQSPDGTLFVGTKETNGSVYAIRDNRVYIVAKGLNMPNGVAFRNGSLYVAEVGRVIRYDNIESRLDDPPAPVIVNDAFPEDEWHGWKFIRFGPDGKLYVPVGAPCNICEKPDPYASIMRMNPDGSELEVYARGVRNTVGFDWDDNGKLWFTDNGRDYLGEDVPPDELNYAPVAGLHFGFPYCHGGDIPDPEYGKGKNCPDYTPPELKLSPHTAALGMRFYDGTMFPGYNGSVFIAEHGSWNRVEPIGYRVMSIKFVNGTPVRYDIFAEGWLQEKEAWGRPVDVEVMSDGSLLVSDDKAGAIYRITYEGT